MLVKKKRRGVITIFIWVENTVFLYEIKKGNGSHTSISESLFRLGTCRRVITHESSSPSHWGSGHTKMGAGRSGSRHGWMERSVCGGVGLLVLEGERCRREASAVVEFLSRARKSGKAYKKPSSTGGGFLRCHCRLQGPSCRVCLLKGLGRHREGICISPPRSMLCHLACCACEGIAGLTFWFIKPLCIAAA